MYEKTGSMQVRVYTAGGALPLKGSLVRIYGADEENKDVRFSLITDEDGITKKIKLPAPPRELSEDPNTSKAPYALYNVDVIKDGYFEKKIYNLPVFEGINSEQLVGMIPYSKSELNYPNGNLDSYTEDISL